MSARRSGRNLGDLPASLPLRFVAVLAATLLGMAALAGCGQMGPLVLPGAGGQGTAGQADPAADANGEDEAERQNEGGAE